LNDTQVYTTFNAPSEGWTNAVSKIEWCGQDIKANLLKLADTKTEMIVFAPKHLGRHFQNMNIKVRDFNIEPVSLVRNLGMVLIETCRCRNPYIVCQGLSTRAIL